MKTAPCTMYTEHNNRKVIRKSLPYRKQHDSTICHFKCIKSQVPTIASSSLTHDMNTNYLASDNN